MGATQRAVLGLVDGEPVSVAALTASIHGDGFTDSQRRLVARAVASLAARGLVDAHLGARRFRTVAGPARVQRGDPVLLAALGLEPDDPGTVRRVPVVEMFVTRRI